MALADFPRHQLTFGPSPIHPVDRLTAHLGGARVWMKREDVNSGLAFGGNKTRKLEYLVPDALAKGADTLVSIGGVQSNHTRQVAAVAAHLGMKAVLVQEHWVDWPDAVNDRVGNILLSRLMGADVRLSPAGFGIGFKESWRQAISDVEESGGTPYAIPAGASDHRLGGLGFANWAHEVAAQERELGVFFDTIVVCSVTGSTHAGMIAGFADLEQNFGGPRRRVIGIDASAKIDETRDQVARIARNTASLIERGTRAARRRGHRARGLGRRRVRHPRRVDRRGDETHRTSRGRHPRSRLRGQVDGRAHRPRLERRRSPATRTCSTRTSAASPRSTRTAAATTERGRAGAERMPPRRRVRPPHPHCTRPCRRAASRSWEGARTDARCVESRRARESGVRSRISTRARAPAPCRRHEPVPA